MKTNFCVGAVVFGVMLAGVGIVVAGPHDHLANAYAYEVEVATFERLDRELDPEAVAREIGLEPPIMPPSLAKDDVQMIFDRRLEEAVNKQYPRDGFDAIAREAEKKYVIYEVGGEEIVRVGVRARVNGWESWPGRLYEARNDYIKVGDRRISKQDVHPDDKPHFWLAEHEEAIALYVKINRAKFRNARQELLRKQRALLLPEVWRKYGYVKSKSQRNWIARDKYFAAAYQLRWDAAYEDTREEVRQEVLTAHGWRLDEVTGWTPPDGDLPPAEPVPEDGNILSEFKRYLMNLAKKRRGASPPAPKRSPLEGGNSLFDDGPAKTPPKSKPAPPAGDDFFDE